MDHRPEPVPELSPAALAEAARQVRALIEALPPTTARDPATARRIEGAAAALDALATHAGAAVASEDVLDRPDPG